MHPPPPSGTPLPRSPGPPFGRPGGTPPHPPAPAPFGSSSSRMLGVPDGPRIGRYVVLEQVGRGGMGVVHRAFDPELRRPVAIKALGGAGEVDERQRQRFVREARVAARLRHPGIVSVHEVGEHAGRPYLVMDFVDGESLQARLERAPPLSPRRAAEIVRDVARALDHAHDHGIVHRDVKPGNVLLERAEGDAEAGRPLLTDFGLAAEVMGASERLTATGQILGTPHYMAPEQAVTGSTPPGPAADVYGLGGVLYRALAGRPPFEETQLVPLIHKLVAVDAPPLRRVCAAVHADLETIAARCLEKDPARRYPSAGALAADLDRFCKGEPIAARPIGRAARAARWVRRHRVRAGAIALTATAAAVAVGYGVWLAGRARRHVLEQRRAFVAVAVARADDSWRTLERLRADADAGEGRDAERRRRREDRLLAAALDAVTAASTALGLDPTDPATRRRAFDAAMAYGEIARDAEQWGVAASAFDKARLAADADQVARVDAALERLARERERVAAARRAEVQRMLDRARDGTLAAVADGREDALFTIVRHAEAQTVTMLGEALDEVADALGGVTREVLLEALEPTPEEARAGAARLDGLPAALDRWLAWRPGEPLDEGTRRLVADAMRRIDSREKTDGEWRGRASARPSRRRIAWLHEQRFGPGSAQDLLALARLCCDALGRIGIAEGSIAPLGRYLLAEQDELRAIAPAAALARIGGDEVGPYITVAREVWTHDGPLWHHVSRLLAGRLGVAGEMPADADAATFIQRAQLLLESDQVERAAEDAERAVELAPRSIEALATRAQVRLGRRDFDGAIADYRRALELRPDLASLWANLGEARRMQNDFDGAVADITRAIELDASHGMFWLMRGLALERRDPDAALRDLTRAAELVPGRAEAWAHLSMMQTQRGDLARAQRTADRAIEVDATLPDGWLAQGRIHAASGRPDEALRAFTRALELDPRSCEAFTGRGTARLARGDAEGALAEYTRALEVEPGNANAWSNRSNARRMTGDLAGAVADAERAIGLDPTNPSAWTHRGLARYLLGDAAGAEADLTRAIELDPTVPTHWANRCEVRRTRGDLDGAIADGTRTIELDPKLVMGWINRAICRQGRGDVAGAIEDLSAALVLAPRDVGVLWRLGNARQRAGDLPGAIAEHTRALEIDPGYAPALASRGSARRDSGDLQGCVDDCTRAIEADPKDVNAWTSRGAALWDLGEHARARDDLRRALELRPDHPWAERIRAMIASGGGR